MRGWLKLWSLLLCACAARPMGAQLADASRESALEIATELRAIETDPLTAAAEVAEEAGPSCGPGECVCGDGIVSGAEECDLGVQNGTMDGPGGCTLGCTKTHYCGDGVVDPERDEECDLGERNGLQLDGNMNLTGQPGGIVYCTADCEVPVCCFY